jgi:hypothetical protein
MLPLRSADAATCCIVAQQNERIPVMRISYPPVVSKRHGLALTGFLLFGLVAIPVSAAQKPPVGKVQLPTLSYTISKSGPAEGAHPKRSDTIQVNYTLTLVDGTVMDSSASRGQPDNLQLGRLIPAWQVLVQLMRPGDSWTFFVPPEYGYGTAARGSLPANSFLIFEVELLSVTPVVVDKKPE